MTPLQQLRDALVIGAKVRVVHHGLRPESNGRTYEVVGVHRDHVDMIARNVPDVGTVTTSLHYPKVRQDVEWLSDDVVRWTVPTRAKRNDTTVTYSIAAPAPAAPPAPETAGAQS